MIQQQTILVVEDEPQLQSIIKEKLQERGFLTVGVRSIKEAQAILKETHRVDAIWLDHYLIGQEDGLTLVTKIKQQDSQWKELPVFLISNTASPDKIQTYKKLGVDRCYTKSDFSLDQIVDEIKRELIK